MIHVFFDIFISTLLIYLSISSNIGFKKRTFFSFLLATLFFSGFIISFNYLINLQDPLYVDQVSTYTVIRHSIFILIVGFSFLYYLLKKYKNIYSYTFELFSSPFMYEDLRLLINDLNPKILIHISNNIINQIRYKEIKKSIYIAILIFLRFIVPFINTCIFFNFVFLHGDLRYMIYILPFSFLGYLLSFYIYWLDLYSKKNMDFGNKILNIKLKGDIASNITTFAVTSNSFDISLTEFGFSQGYLKSQLPLLSENWITFAHFRHLIRNYTKKTFYVHKFFLIANMVLYINILILFIT